MASTDIDTVSKVIEKFGCFTLNECLVSRATDCQALEYFQIIFIFTLKFYIGMCLVFVVLCTFILELNLISILIIYLYAGTLQTSSITLYKMTVENNLKSSHREKIRKIVEIWYWETRSSWFKHCIIIIEIEIVYIHSLKAKWVYLYLKASLWGLGKLLSNTFGFNGGLDSGIVECGWVQGDASRHCHAQFLNPTTLMLG
jgi:hypothetical protein